MIFERNGPDLQTDAAGGDLGAELFRALVENSSDVIALVGPDTTFAYVSPSVERTFGYSPGELQGQQGLAMVHPEDLDHAARELSKVLQIPGGVSHAEVRVRHKDGTWRWADCATTNKLDDPAVGGLVVVFRDITQQRQAEQELAESEQRFRALIESAAHGVVAVDVNGRIVLANAEAERMFGYSREELVGSPLEILVPRASRETHEQARDTYMAAPVIRRVSPEGLKGRRKDGSEFPADISLSHVPTKNGPLVLGLISDVTERTRAEERIAFQARLLAEVDEAVVATDEQLRITYWNRGAEKLYGWSAGETIGRPAPDVLGSVSTKAERATTISAAKESHRAKMVEFLHHRRDGAAFTAELAVSVRTDEAGRILGHVLVIRDATERLRAQEQIRHTLERLEASERRHRDLVEHSPDGILVTAGGPILFANPAAAEILGAFSPADLLGRPVLDVIHSDFHDQARERMAAEIEGRPMPLVRYKFVRLDGREIDVEVKGIPIMFDGQPAAQGVFHDVTDRLRGEDELRRSYESLEQKIEDLKRSEEQRRRLLTGLVHAQEEERRTIAADIHDDSIQKVTAASMRLEMIVEDHPELAEDEEFSQAREGVRLSIESLRHLMFELRPYVLDRDGLQAALRRLLEQEGKLSGSPAYHLEGRLREEPPETIRITLYRIAQEAIANARKHARASRVELVIEGKDGGFSLRVSDDGVGFDISGNGDSPLGHLGLTSMRERATLAGGRFQIESAPGLGTVVECQFPGHEPHPASA